MQIQRIHDEDLEFGVTPYFKYITVENVPQSERKRELVMETREVVEIRFAGDKNYSPVVPVDSMFKMDGHNVITYAERWPDQYRSFLSGAAQEATGTPLEKLQSYGISPAQLSLCRALKVYNIESLYNLDGQNLKNLGMNANALKEMATKFMEDRAKGSETQNEIDRLKAEIAALKAATPLPGDEREELAKLPEGYELMSDEQLKDAIAAKAGARPRGQPSRETLIRTLQELDAA